MRGLHAFAVFLLLICTPDSCYAVQRKDGSAESAEKASWTPLFNGKSFDGWYANLKGQKKGEDPTKVFQVEDGVIHVYKDHADGGKVTYGYLATNSEYAYYRMRLEFKWGSKKFQPRLQQRRDAGMLYHLTGNDAVWPRCFECQIQENDVGDCFAVLGSRLTAPVEIANIETPSGLKKLPRYKPRADGGTPTTIGEGQISRVVKLSTHEHDGWNTVEVAVSGSERAAHLVNGEAVFEATDLQELGPDKNNWGPLAKGRVALQAEYSEVFYRNIEIQAVPQGPLNAAQK